MDRYGFPGFLDFSSAKLRALFRLHLHFKACLMHEAKYCTKYFNYSTYA